MDGMLSIVATPIGNLDDLSPRAARTLAEADVIACEDTRVTRKLLTRVGSHGKLVSYRSANERAKAAEIADRIASGARVALVTDAGTPGVSDPGHPLVEECLARGLRVEIVPGPSAAIAALVVSGLPSARFVFEGFLPHSRNLRRERLRKLKSETRTLVLFEAPHRLAEMLGDVVEALGGERRVAMAREMTKLHEQVTRTTLGELLESVRSDGVRGEITLVVEGAPEHAAALTDGEIAELVHERIDAGLTTKDAVAAVAEETGEPKNRIYRIATGA